MNVPIDKGYYWAWDPKISRWHLVFFDPRDEGVVTTIDWEGVIQFRYFTEFRPLNLTPPPPPV